MPIWRIAAVAAAIALYGVLSHLLMVHAAQAPWAVAALFGPLVVGVGAAAFSKKQHLVLLACAALVLLLALIVWRGGVADINRMYVLQHGGIHLALAWGFGQSLRSGHTPLITGIAEKLHCNFTPEMRAYTDGLTRAWVAYFVGMVLLSGAIYALAPWPWWSVFCNLLTPLFAVAFFVGEHVVRYARNPHFERVSMRSAFAAYQASENSGNGAPR
jgi:uncharacterized membrane protein